MWQIGDSEESMIERGYKKKIPPTEFAPWRQPGYTGKLKPTIDIFPPNGLKITIDEAAELVDQWNIEGILTDEQSEKLHERIREAIKQGRYTL